MSEVDHEQPIVVGIDGSENSLAALRWALREGVTLDAPVEVVHCWTAQTFTDIAFGSTHELETASVCMLQNEVQTALAEMPEPPVALQFSLHGNPASILVKRSAAARMLVLGVRQTTVMRDLVHGAVVTVCQKHAACPVVTVDRLKAAVWQHPTTVPQVTVG